MSQDERKEEESIWRALEALRPGAEPRGAGPDAEPSDEEETLRALHREVWGLLPYALEPVAPSETSRRRILAAIGRQRKREASPSAKGPEDSVQPAAGPPRPAPAVPPEPRRGRWITLLAATVAIAALGLAGWLWIERGEREAVLAELRHALLEPSAPEVEISEIGSQVATLRDEADRLQRQLSMFASPAIVICPLRPAGPEPPQPAARGLVYLQPTSDKWLLTASGLETPPAGQVYQIWFLFDGGANSGGTFSVQAGVPVQVTASGLPEGLHAIALTLEPAEGALSPTGPRILYGAEEEMIRPLDV